MRNCLCVKLSGCEDVCVKLSGVKAADVKTSGHQNGSKIAQARESRNLRCRRTEMRWKLHAISRCNLRSTFNFSIVRRSAEQNIFDNGRGFVEFILSHTISAFVFFLQHHCQDQCKVTAVVQSPKKENVRCPRWVGYIVTGFFEKPKKTKGMGTIFRT